MGRSQSPARELLIVEVPGDVRRHVASARRGGLAIGLVPTMGALHEGHLSLIREARARCGYVVVSIFVNPTQFGPHEDYARYPRPVETDLAACREEGVDLVFQPAAVTMYGEGYGTYVEVEQISTLWEGAHRPGHFRGVTTVVLKLFNIVQPDIAFFGRKDYQQQLLIRTMCRDLDVPVEIRTCPTVRERDGLALSSRNRYLNARERESALALSQSLKLAAERVAAGEKDMAAVRRAMVDHLQGVSGVEVDYATIVHPETLEEPHEPLGEMVALVAARVGKTRLIDNIAIEGPRSTR